MGGEEGVRLTSPVVALLVADIHLSLKPPRAREGETSWFGAMERALKQLRDLQARHGAIVLCAGDVFDRWGAPPELINWALERLPHLHAVPGNHDLPNHRPELVHRSAYGTLVRAGKITELGGWPVYHRGLALYGRPFGEWVPQVRRSPRALHVLVTHQFLWVPGAGHEGADKRSELSRAGREFRGFDVVVSGDNHIPFEKVVKGGTLVVNCGSLLRRRADEAGHQPKVGLLHASGVVTYHPLDLRGERLSPVVGEDEREVQEVEGVGSLVEALSTLESSSLDYRDNVVRAMEDRKTGSDVRDILLEAMG